MEFQLNFLKSQKMILKCYTQYVSSLENSAMAIRLKRLVLIPIPKKCNAREHSSESVSHLVVSDFL